MILPLTKIGFFNPGRLTDEEIEQSFIARISLFRFVFKKIVSEKPSSIPQHHLLIGQRGMGKTSLLIRMAAELRKSPYKDAFIPLSFPEEQYNIDRLSKFWLNCLDALADELDKEGRREELNALDTEIRNLSRQTALDANAVYNTFKKWVDKTGRRPILLVDNLNLIFSKISKEEQHQLRATLMSKGAPVLIGASATPIDETLDYGAPFYDAFQTNYLKKLSFNESMDVLTNLAKITGNADFANNLYRQKGKVNALYDLTGGTPRTLAILFPLIQNGFSEDIQTDLDALLDVVTPLYKARFEELSQQLQVVLDAAALNWDPITIEQLREKTLLENQQLSPQLKRLIDVGWLQKLDAYEAKGGAYEVSERFFNIWYLMRRSSRRQKRELYCLTKFLETFYGSDLHDIAKARVNCTIDNTNQAALQLALADAVKEKRLSNKLRSKSYEAIMNLSFVNEDVLKEFSIPQHITSKKAKELIAEVNNLFKEEKYNDAEPILQKVVKLDKYNDTAWNALGRIYQSNSDRYNDAADAFIKATEITPNNFQHWVDLGLLYLSSLKEYEEAANAFEKAVKINKQRIDVWTILGDVYKHHLNEYQKAEKSFQTAISFKEDFIPALSGLAELYMNNLSNYQKAEIIFKRITQLDSNNPYPWNGLGDLYMFYLNKFQEAEIAFKKAISLNEKEAHSWRGLGILYQNHLDRFEEAEKAYLKFAELDKSYDFVWVTLGGLYMFKLEKFTDAEKAFKKAISLNKNQINAWMGLGFLYTLNLHKYEEAEISLRKAIQINEEDALSWNTLGQLYQDHLRNFKEAEKAFLKCISLNDEPLYSQYNLIFLWRDDMNKIQEAKELFNTIEITEKLKDTHLLNQALFAYHDKNIGIAENFLKEALLSIGDSLPPDTTGDWYRSVGVIIKLGYAESLLNVFRENGYDTIFRPFYVAIEALAKKEDERFFNSVAAEVREPAKKIMAMIKNHIA